MLRFCQVSAATKFIVGTEIGLIHTLQKDSPDKAFLPATPLADCPNMKLNTIEKMVWALEDMLYEVTIPPETANAARTAIERMLELS